MSSRLVDSAAQEHSEIPQPVKARRQEHDLPSCSTRLTLTEGNRFQSEREHDLDDDGGDFDADELLMDCEEGPASSCAGFAPATRVPDVELEERRGGFLRFSFEEPDFLGQADVGGLEALEMDLVVEEDMDNVRCRSISADALEILAEPLVGPGFGVPVLGAPASALDVSTSEEMASEGATFASQGSDGLPSDAKSDSVMTGSAAQALLRCRRLGGSEASRCSTPSR